MSLAEFHVRLAPGEAQVYVNGAEVPGVRAVRIAGSEEGVPRILLEAVGNVTVDGVGKAEAAPEAAAELDDILASINTETLDREVLEGLGLGDSGSTGAAYLEAIRRYVRGD
jgi:hypothetical protein